MTYCQPYVAADFNFMLEDQSVLGGWQSGLLWADGTRKGSYDPFKAVVAQVNSGTVNCSLVSGAPLVSAPPVATPAGSVKPTITASEVPPTRSITKVTYIGATRAPFGFLRLRARLTKGVVASKTVLRGRTLFFAVGKTTYRALTNRLGIAEVAPSPPLAPGTHRIAVRYHGDAHNLGSGLHIDTTVVNSAGRVASKGLISLPDRRSLRISVASDGGPVSGDLVLGGPGLERAVAIGSLGVTQRRRDRLAARQRSRGSSLPRAPAADPRKAACPRRDRGCGEHQSNGVGAAALVRTAMRNDGMTTLEGRMSPRLLISGAGTAVLALWLAGVAGWLGTDPTENWTLFGGGVLLVVASGAVLPRRQ